VLAVPQYIPVQLVFSRSWLLPTFYHT